MEDYSAHHVSQPPPPQRSLTCVIHSTCLSVVTHTSSDWTLLLVLMSPPTRITVLCRFQRSPAGRR